MMIYMRKEVNIRKVSNSKPEKPKDSNYLLSAKIRYLSYKKAILAIK